MFRVHHVHVQFHLRVMIPLALFTFSCTEKKTILLATDSGISESKGITFYHNEPFNGTIIGLFGEQDTNFIAAYKDGKMEGAYKEYYTGHKLKEIRYFENGRKSGLHEGFWENGNRRFAYHFKDDVYEGNVKEWSEAGLIYRDFNYENGQEEGLQKMWFDNGKLRANYEVRNGRRFGLQGTKNCNNVAERVR